MRRQPAGRVTAAPGRRWGSATAVARHRRSKSNADRYGHSLRPPPVVEGHDHGHPPLPAERRRRRKAGGTAKGVVAPPPGEKEVRRWNSVAWRTRRASWSDWTATSAGHLAQKDTPQREPAGRHGGRGRRGARETRGDHGPAGQQRRRRRHASDTISCHCPPTRRPAVDCGPVAEEALPCMAAGSMSQSRDKVAGARVFYPGTEPPPPIGHSLPYRTFAHVCPPPQPAQRWGHFWEKCHKIWHFAQKWTLSVGGARLIPSWRPVRGGTLCQACAFAYRILRSRNKMPGHAGQLARGWRRPSECAPTGGPAP